MEIMVYKACNAILTKCDADLSAAEAHGMATALLCVNERISSDDWLAELLRNAGSLGAEDNRLLVRLFEQTRRLLFSDEFEFDLFLPDDDSLLSERADALKNWCRGFLFGIGFGHLANDFNKETREILKDITEFTRLDTDVDGEEDENDFAEITEYLRSAVLLLRDELSDDNQDRDEYIGNGDIIH